MDEFSQKLSRLKDDLTTQGNRVVDHVLRAVECYFSIDEALAQRVIDDDEVIDQVDVEIERASIPLLAMGRTDEHEIRSVLTIVKINNELERIADCAVNIAEIVVRYGEHGHGVPQTFRVMANSVIGMLEEANKSLSALDVKRAEYVLAQDDAVDRFKREIVLDAQRRIASGDFDVPFAFQLHAVTKALERIADHCTNICEQVIYLESGQIVRHKPEGWTKPVQP